MQPAHIDTRLVLAYAAFVLTVLFGLGGCPGSQSDATTDSDTITAGITDDDGTIYDLAGGTDDGNDPGDGDGDGSDADPSNGDGGDGDAGDGEILDPPTVYSLGVFVVPETATEIQLSGESPSGEPLEFVIVSPPAMGSLSVIEPVDDVHALVTYTPADDFLGQTQFSYFASDGVNDSNVATVTLVVSPAVYFDLDSYEGVAPLTVTGHAFTITGDPLPEGEYRWNWGDLEEGGPVQVFGLRAHTYVSPGAYTVGLSVLLAGLTQPIACTHSYERKQSPFASVAVQPQISGQVHDSNGAPLAGVTILSDGGAQVLSGADGRYVLPVPFHWSGTVTPSLNGYAFTPPSMSYAPVTHDQVAGNYVGMSDVSPGVLVVSPAEGLASSGVVGGPFSPSSIGYTLSNAGEAALNWTAAATQAWISVSPAGGALIGGATASVTVSINTNANSLPANSYGDAVLFTNTTDGQGDTSRTVTLTVTPPGQCAIAGLVRDGSNNPISGVAVSANNGGGSGTTAANGSYTLNVPYNWSGRVTPSKAGWTFSPAYKDYVNVQTAQTGQNYVGTAVTFAISGLVRDGSNNPISGVTVSANNGGGSGTTAADGSYTLSVPYNWSGRVTPSKAGWTFSPAYKDYVNVQTAQTGQNYTGTAVTFAISGLVRDGSNNPISGVVVSANNGGGSGTSGADGAYTLSVPYNWSGRVTPSKAGWTFSPAFKNYVNVLANQAGHNYTANPPAALIANAGEDKTVSGGASTTLDGAASGGTPPYSYAWTPTTGLNNPSIAQPTATPAETTAYTLTVTDSAGALAADTVLVTVVVGHLYYVATNDANASDGNPGTETLPWKTLTKAGNAAQAGDTVLVKAGTYDETLMPAASGTAGAPLTFEACSGAAVVIDGQNTRSNGVNLTGRQYIHVVGFEIRNHTGDAVYVQSYSGSTAEGHALLGNYIHHNGDYVTWQGSGVAIQASNLRNSLIEGNHITYNGDTAIRLGGAGMLASQVVVRDNDIHYNGRDGISGGGTALTIEYNYFHDNCHTSLHQDALDLGILSGCVIRYNTFSDYTQLIYGPLKDEAGRYWNDVQVYGNIFYKNVYAGTHPAVYVDAARSGAQVTGLQIHSNTICYLGDLQKAIIIYGVTGATIDNITIRNNIFYNCRGSAGGSAMDWSSLATNVSSDYNCFYNTTPKSGHDAHSVFTDPLFVDYSSFDLHVMPESTCVDAGDPGLPDVVPLPSPFVDIDGRLRPQLGGFDIGAYEH